MIPKRIIYCWFGGKPKPDGVKYCISTWKKHMPDWEFLEINEKNFDIKSNKYSEAAYKNKMWGFVADPIRLWALYKYGGIYLDTDIEAYKSFEDLLDNEMFMGFEQHHYLSTATIGATKGNKIIKEMLDDYDKETFEVKEHWYDYKTSPMVMTDTLSKYFDRDLMEYQKTDKFTIYPRKYFTRSDTMDDEVYCKHHMFGSWQGTDYQVIIMCGGKYHDFKKHKALSKVRGEILIERTIRLLQENGVNDWYISTNDSDFDKYGNILHHENNFEVINDKVTGYWVDAYYPTNKATIYLHGDVYYTEEAMRKILKLNPSKNTLVGNEIARNKEHLNWGEPFGWIIPDQSSFKNAIERTKILQDMGMFERGYAISWELYRVLYCLDINKMNILDDSYLSIDDETIDIDEPEQIDLVNEGKR